MSMRKNPPISLIGLICVVSVCVKDSRANPAITESNIINKAITVLASMKTIKAEDNPPLLKAKRERPPTKGATQPIPANVYPKPNIKNYFEYQFQF